jgi:hypothetical protein
VKRYPDVPHIEDVPPELLDSGHLWLTEYVAGVHLRFTIEDSGLIRFGDRNRTYDPAESLPDPYERGVEHVRANLQRDALRAAVDTSAVVFFGQVPDPGAYDDPPGFLGFGVWNGERFRPPDAVAGIFEAVDLTPVHAFERELHTRDFDPDSYVVPESAWRDGPAKGVVVENKTGSRAVLCR